MFRQKAIAVMAGLVQAIHDFVTLPRNSWMPGTSAGHDSLLIFVAQ
jgi:hypothetical protein